MLNVLTDYEFMQNFMNSVNYILRCCIIRQAKYMMTKTLLWVAISSEVHFFQHLTEIAPDRYHKVDDFCRNTNTVNPILLICIQERCKEGI